MTNIDVQQSGRVNATSTHNVIAVSFDPDNDAYQALTTLKELDVQGRLGIEAAAVVVRGDNGQIVVTDREATKELVHGRRERSKEQVHAKVEQLKAKLPQREQAASAGV